MTNIYCLLSFFGSIHVWYINEKSWLVVYVCSFPCIHHKFLKHFLHDKKVFPFLSIHCCVTRELSGQLNSLRLLLKSSLVKWKRENEIIQGFTGHLRNKMLSITLLSVILKAFVFSNAINKIESVEATIF